MQDGDMFSKNGGDGSFHLPLFDILIQIGDL